MHAVGAQGDEHAVRFKRMSLRLRGGLRPTCRTRLDGGPPRGPASEATIGPARDCESYSRKQLEKTPPC